jgi:ribosome maturation factor RimP
MEDRERKLSDLVEPAVAAQGVRLVETSVGGSGRGTVVRIVIHSPDGVSHADCARVTRACGEAIEAAGALGGNYSIEVSSPGTARVFKSGREFEVFRGEPVRVRLEAETEERTGTCAGTRGQDVVLRDSEGNETLIPWSSVTKARLAADAGREFGGKAR